MKKETNMTSRAWRLSNLYKITNKAKQTIVFRPNNLQQEILEYKRECREAGKPYRFICLKARQGGITTEEVIDGLDTCIFYSNQDVTLSAHTIEKAEEIFRIAKFAFERLPGKVELKDGRTWEKPKPQLNSKREYYFPGLNSRFKVVRDTRSITPSRVHITELAFNEDAAGIMTAIEGGLSEFAHLSIETTANGITGPGAVFYNLWNQNYSSPHAQFKCFFFAWYSMDDYESDIPLSQLDDDYYWIEKQKYLPKLQALGLSERKISWYIQKAKRMTLAAKGGGEMVTIEQEFPSTPEEAFMTSTETVFDLDYIKPLEKLKDHLWKNSVQDSLYPDLRFYHLDSSNRPIPEKNIGIGVDVAEGVIKGDYSTIVGRRRGDRKLLFAYRGHIKPDLLAGVIDRIYKYGYQGVVGIERNNHGHATLLACQAYMFRYDLYAEKTYDQKTNVEKQKLGWSTNGSTKTIMISGLEQAIREGMSEFDKREWSEFFKFVHQEDGSMGAIAPDHDDLIIADSICVQMTLQKYDTIS